jgi:hypothetical protein
MTQISEPVAFETPGHAGSLQWKERATGTWVARGLGGTFHVYPDGGGFKAYWDADGTGQTTLIGSFGTLGAALAACSRHQHGKEAAESGSDALASNVARQSVASAYGADQIASVSGHGSSYSVTLKNGKRLRVEVDGSKGTVIDPADGHVVATHTVSEAAECGCQHAHPATVPTSPCDAAPVPVGAVALAIAGASEVEHRRERLGIKMHHWHAGMSDPMYAVGSYYVTNKPYPHKERVQAALDETDTLLRRAKTKGDGAELRSIRAGLKHFLKVDYPKQALEGASETVPVIHEANDAGPYATVNRDTKELAKGQALGMTATPRAIYDLLHDQLSKESQEVFLVIPLNLYGKPISRPVEIARGQRDRVTVSIEDILRPVIATNAKGFVVVHNHPGLRAKPSPKDRELTASIKKAAADYSFTFLDHVIIATNGKHGEYYSFTENELHTVR